MYYGWSKEFLEAGKRRLAGDTARAATSDEVKDLRREAQALKEVVADLTLENRLLKKRMARPAPFARGLIESAERSVCFNVSGLGGCLPAKMEIRALRSS
jgi:transposase